MDLLIRAYGCPTYRPRGRCLDLLVRFMLAQNTQPACAASAYRQLRRAFGTWNAVMNAPIDDVRRCLSVVGLARMRARRLQNMLRIMHQRHGRLDLEFLSEQAPDEAYAYLTGYFGIGQRTAAAALLFAFNMALFPVDLRTHRLIKRLSLVRAKASPTESGRAIGQMLGAAGDCYALHLLMYKVARAKCRPRNPKCDECPLVGVCPFGQRRLRHRPPAMVEKKPRRPLILSGYASAGIMKHPNKIFEEDASLLPR